jgi:hypothetical protein
MAPKMFDSNNPVTVGVYTALAAWDVSCAWRFVQEYCEPQSSNPNDHIRAVNRYWREQLANALPDTLGVRANLIDNIALEDWLRLFAQNVAPVIASLNLPQALSQGSGPMPSFGFAAA